MIKAFIRFNKGLFGMSLGVKHWLGVLVLVNLVVPLIYLQQTEARIVLGTFFAGFILMVILTALTGYSRLLGLGHILWIPLIIFLWSRIGLYPATEIYGFWMRAVIALNFVSLVIDAIDVVRYLRGERGEVVEGLS